MRSVVYTYLMTTAQSNSSPQPTCTDCDNTYDERFGGAGRCSRCLKVWSAARAEASSARRVARESGQSRTRRERADHWDAVNNEGGYGYNPYRDGRRW